MIALSVIESVDLVVPVHKLLALDQASRISGWAVFYDNELKAYGKIVTEQENVGERLVQIREEVQKLIEKYDIDEVVMEDIQLQSSVGNNVQTFKVLAEVFGVIYETLTELNIKNSAVLASSWKSTLGIKGRNRQEQKKNAQNYVIDKYNIKPTQDEADAIAIGTHHLVKKQQNSIHDWSD